MLAVGIAVGALVVQPVVARGPGTGTAVAEPAGVSARWASCIGSGFYPLGSAVPYATSGIVRWGAGLLACPSHCHMERGVTTVKFQLYDVDALTQVRDCSVTRLKLDPIDGPSQILAGPLSSGLAFEGAIAVRVDTTISNAVIDNRRFAHRAACTPDVDDASLGIVGVTVRYLPST